MKPGHDFASGEPGARPAIRRLRGWWTTFRETVAKLCDQELGLRLYIGGVDVAIEMRRMYTHSLLHVGVSELREAEPVMV